MSCRLFVRSQGWCGFLGNDYQRYNSVMLLIGCIIPFQTNSCVSSARKKKQHNTCGPSCISTRPPHLDYFMLLLLSLPSLPTKQVLHPGPLPAHLPHDLLDGIDPINGGIFFGHVVDHNRGRTVHWWDHGHETISHQHCRRFLHGECGCHQPTLLSVVSHVSLS